MRLDPAAGVWTGRFRSASLKGTATGLVMANGAARWFTTDGALIAGAFKGKDESVSGKLYVNRGSAPTQIAILTGTLGNARAKGTFKGEKLSGSFELTRVKTKPGPVKLAELTGTWGKAGLVINVLDGGKFTSSNATGCRWTGQFSSPLRNYPAVAFRLEVDQCGAAGAHGGQALLVDDGDTETLIVGGSRPGGVVVEFLKRASPKSPAKPAASAP